MPYDPKHIEPKWQQYWEANGTFAAQIDLAKPKFYILDMFPYPSGQGLHVGHPEGYTATDIVARYKRMRGFNVLHPMGQDAYGLLAERYADDRAIVDPGKERYWMPVDLYVGGAEHAVLHLLYARFWHKVLQDIGIVSTKEPFRKLFNQGMILAFSYRDAAGKYYEPEKVIQREGHHFAGDIAVTQKIEKRSKSRFNVVDPDDIVAAYGADSLRLLRRPSRVT